MKVKAVPNAKVFSITKANGKITVRLKSKAHENAANMELVKELGKLFKRKVSITRGSKSREKDLSVEGLTDEQAMKLIP